MFCRARLEGMKRSTRLHQFAHVCRVISFGSQFLPILESDIESSFIYMYVSQTCEHLLVVESVIVLFSLFAGKLHVCGTSESFPDFLKVMTWLSMVTGNIVDT